MREKLIKQLRFAALRCDRTNKGCVFCKDLLKAADELVNGVTVQRHGRWELVSEPPKRFEKVLVYYPNKDYGSKYVVDYNESCGNEVTHFAEQWHFGKPTHWMPLPEPPKEGEA